LALGPYTFVWAVLILFAIGVVILLAIGPRAPVTMGTPVQLMVVAPAPSTALEPAGAEQSIPAPPIAAVPRVEQAPAVAASPALTDDRAAALAPATPTFDGRPLRKARVIRMVVTAYSPDARSCGKFADGITASGYSVWTNGMKLVAADTRMLPFGSVVSVPGYHGGKPVPVLDRGGRIKGRRLDLLMPTHGIAREWGKRTCEVTVWEYAD
jgi:3D (Asp-Asp-Asp) domain-containing protein